MTKRKKQDAPVVISVRGPNGRMTHTPVISREGQQLVGGVLNRLSFLRANGDEDLLSMDEVLRYLDVPEDDQGDCVDFIADFLNEGDGAWVDYRNEPIPRDIYRELRDSLPVYEGSWLQRMVISRSLIDDLGASDLNLLNLASIANRFADSLGASEDEICKEEAAEIVRDIANEIRRHTATVEPDDAAVLRAA